jgi:hypothetical protein
LGLLVNPAATMTAITLNLPDDLAAQLLSQAASSKMSLEAFLQECVSDFALSGESALASLHLTREERKAVARAGKGLTLGVSSGSAKAGGD